MTRNCLWLALRRKQLIDVANINGNKQKPIRNVSKYEVDKFVEKKHKPWLWRRTSSGAEPTPTIGKIAKSVTIVHPLATKTATALFVMYKLYLKGNFTAVSLSMLIKTMFILDNPSKRIFTAMTTPQGMRPGWNTSTRRKGTARETVSKSHTAKSKINNWE